MKIKNQLRFTHGLLVVLALIIVIFNGFTFNRMNNDAYIINESGKLRAYSYNMAQLVNQNHTVDEQEDMLSLIKLEKRINDFDNILSTLNDSKGYNSMVNNHEASALKLNLIIQKWEDDFKPSYELVVDRQSSSDLQSSINQEIDIYVSLINDMVTSYSEYAENRVVRAFWINGFLLILIVLTSIYSLKTTYKKIQKPLNILMEELKHISLIDGELSEKIRNIKTDEISEMTEYFNEMMYDQLTKTLNRRSGLSKLSSLFDYKQRRKLELSLCFIDINGLKEVNDALGHKYGDELIVSVVDVIKEEIREKDFVIRMGGDEFLIVFNDINETISEKVWQRINNTFSLINETDNKPYIISVSHGIVEYDNFEKSEVEILIKNADEKMYAEKRKIKEGTDFKIIK